MTFSEETLKVGGLIRLPDSFVNSKDDGEIIAVTSHGINVVFFKGKKNEQVGFYSFAWLNQQYGHLDIELNDEIPF